MDPSWCDTVQWSNGKQPVQRSQVRFQIYINPLTDNKIVDWTKSKQIADNILKCIYNKAYAPYSVENMRKGEIACHKQLYIFSVSKCSIEW